MTTVLTAFGEADASRDARAGTGVPIFGAADGAAVGVVRNGLIGLVGLSRLMRLMVQNFRQPPRHNISYHVITEHPRTPTPRGTNGAPSGSSVAGVAEMPVPRSPFGWHAWPASFFAGGRAKGAAAGQVGLYNRVSGFSCIAMVSTLGVAAGRLV
jgi:hypothetical protein